MILGFYVLHGESLTVLGLASLTAPLIVFALDIRIRLVKQLLEMGFNIHELNWVCVILRIRGIMRRLSRLPSLPAFLKLVALSMLYLCLDAFFCQKHIISLTCNISRCNELLRIMHQNVFFIFLKTLFLRSSKQSRVKIGQNLFRFLDQKLKFFIATLHEANRTQTLITR